MDRPFSGGLHAVFLLPRDPTGISITASANAGRVSGGTRSPVMPFNKQSRRYRRHPWATMGDSRSRGFEQHAPERFLVCGVDQQVDLAQ